MQTVVTGSAERNEVLLRIVSTMTAKLLMMNLKIGHRAALLAAPTIPS